MYLYQLIELFSKQMGDQRFAVLK